MTHRKDATSDVLGRWRMLAEQRLEHLTELFESGRWRRYHSEVTFLENIREAKIAVEIWRDLSTPGSVPEAAPAPVRQIDPPPALVPEPVETTPAAEMTATPEPPIDLLALERAPDGSEEVLDLTAIERRYPSLRNTL